MAMADMEAAAAQGAGGVSERLALAIAVLRAESYDGSALAILARIQEDLGGASPPV